MDYRRVSRVQVHTRAAWDECQRWLPQKITLLVRRLARNNSSLFEPSNLFAKVALLGFLLRQIERSAND